MRRLLKTGGVATAAVAIALAAAACTQDEPAVDGAPPATETGGVATETDGGMATEADLETKNFAFSPTDLTVASGDTITVANSDGVAHTFTVADSDIDVTNESGQSQEVTIDLEAGTYDFMCRFHSAMTGTLTVT
ncbi:MAG TPA: cupredoxin domain-containing protein [Actinomycetota bacterium]|nr:cupredoxin domain-containing protein [Actinomycetota bacterium]